MTHPPTTTNRRRTRARRRGSVYLLVLGVSSIVMVIGLSALAAVRVQHRGSTDQTHAAQAQALADAGLQLALERLAHNAAWRTDFTHDQWGNWEALGDGNGGLMIKLIDLDDTNLADNDQDPFRLVIRATRGDAVRLVSVEVQAQPPLGPELVTNGDTEAGPSPFAVNIGAATVSAFTDSPHAGTTYLQLQGRATSLSAWEQNLDGLIASGKTYRVSAWVRMATAPELVALGIYYPEGLFSPHYKEIRTNATTDWTHITSNLTPDYSTAPSEVTVYSRSTSSNQDLHFDDVSVREVLDTNPFQVVQGSYRRELDP